MRTSALYLPLKVKQKHHTSISKSWLVVSLIVLAATSIPYFVYITDQNTDLLLMMIQIVIGTQIIVTVRTLLTVNTTFARLRQMTGNMDLLKLTGVDANMLIFGNWRMLVRQTALPHFLLVLSKLGLVLGIAQFLHVAQFYPCNELIRDVFCYYSHNSSYPDYWDVYFWQPVLIQFVLALALLMLYTYAEVRLIVAVSIWINMTPIKRRELLLGAGFLLRLGIIVFAIVGFKQSGDLRTPFLYRHFNDFICYDEQGNYHPDWRFTEQCPNITQTANIHRVIDTVQVSLFSLNDAGLMLSSNLMRPNLSHRYRIDTLDLAFRSQVIYLKEEIDYQSYRDTQWNISAWRFIFRMFGSATLGLILYSIITYGLLYSAQRMAMRRGFL